MNKDHDDRIDLELSQLPRVDLDPASVRSTRGAALRVLHPGTNLEVEPRSRSTRCVPTLLYVLSAAQLLWAATRLVAWSR